MTVIAVAGLISSGKDSVADYLITTHGYKKLSFAGSLKDAVAAVFGWDRSMVEGNTPEGRIWRETVDKWWEKKLNIPGLTPRWVLQQWGTEVCRVHFHPEIWVASVENKLRNTTDNIVITDCRFRNEIEAVKNAKGTTIRITRGPEPEWYADAAAYNRGPDGNSRWSIGKATLDRLGVHASEYSGIGLKYDHHIDNNGTIADLHATVENIINPRSDRRASNSLLSA